MSRCQLMYTHNVWHCSVVRRRTHELSCEYMAAVEQSTLQLPKQTTVRASRRAATSTATCIGSLLLVMLLLSLLLLMLLLLMLLIPLLPPKDWQSGCCHQLRTRAAEAV